MDSIIEWADRKIIGQSASDLFFDLSIVRTTHKIIELLSEKVNWNYNDTEVRTLVLIYYKVYLNNNLSIWLKIEKELMEYFELLEFNNGNDSAEDFLYYLNDDWDVRKDGYGGLLTMPYFLIENLNDFNEYSKLVALLKTQDLIGYEV